jgi:hypothetical protein
MKVTLNTIGSRYGSIDALNDNFDRIQDAFDNTLSLDGTSPNEMLANLNMGGNNIINIGSLFLAGGGKLLDETDKAYIISYVDTQDAADRAYADSVVSAAISNIQLELVEGDVTSARYMYNAVGGETFITLPYTGFTTQEVFKNGVHQNSNDYSVANNIITFVEALGEGDRIYVMVAFPMSSGPTNSIATELFTATDNQTTFLLTAPVLDNTQSFVFINGVKQSGLAYTVNANEVVFVSGLSEGDLVEVMVLVNVQESVSVVNPILLQHQVVSSNTLIPTGFNGLSVDPTIAGGVVVTISSGSVWAIVGE